MTFGNSGIYCANVIDVFDATQLAIDLSLTTNKVALYTNSITTPNFDTDTAYSSTNEIPNGSGYTTGGAAVASPTNTVSPTGSWMHDLADTAWTSSTFSSVRGAIAYADALVGNNVYCAITFGADYAVTAGTFTIQWAATGMFAIDLTP